MALAKLGNYLKFWHRKVVFQDEFGLFFVFLIYVNFGWIRGHMYRGKCWSKFSKSSLSYYMDLGEIFTNLRYISWDINENKNIY